MTDRQRPPKLPVTIRQVHRANLRPSHPEPPEFSRADFERHVGRLQPLYEDLGLTRPGYPERFGERFA